jgi:hypothetical protein
MVSIHRTNSIADEFSAPLREAWDASKSLLAELVQRLDIPTDVSSQALFINAQATDDPDGTIREFARNMTPEEQVTYLTIPTMEGKSHRVMIVPSKNSQSKNAHLVPFIEIHSRLVAWWLTTTWRSLDLAQSTWELTDADRVISAAACSRALLETAAAFWCAAKEMSEIWNAIKLNGLTRDSGLRGWHELNSWIWRTTYGAKFDSRSPDLEKAWKKLSSTNVVTYIDKLAKAVPKIDLQTKYQWLCNTVHPSCGGTFAMSTPLATHASGAHAFAWFAPFPIHMESRGGHVAERTVHEAIATLSIVAVRVIVQTLDDSLCIIDDLGLTTGAAKLATFAYWRQLQVATRKQRCPCRSGLTFEKCRHHWKEPSTSIRSNFSCDDL